MFKKKHVQVIIYYNFYTKIIFYNITSILFCILETMYFAHSNVTQIFAHSVTHSIV